MAGQNGFNAPVRPLCVKQGEYREWRYVHTADGTATGEPVDITNALIESEVRDSRGNLLVRLTPFIVDGAAGVFSLVIMDFESEALPTGSSVDSILSRHEYDAFITPVGGRRKALVGKSPFAVDPSSTRLAT